MPSSTLVVAARRGPLQEEHVVLVDHGLQLPGGVRYVGQQLGKRLPDPVLAPPDAGRRNEDGLIGVVGDDFIQIARALPPPAAARRRPARPPHPPFTPRAPRPGNRPPRHGCRTLMGLPVTLPQPCCPAPPPTGPPGQAMTRTASTRRRRPRPSGGAGDRPGHPGPRHPRHAGPGHHRSARPRRDLGAAAPGRPQTEQARHHARHVPRAGHARTRTRARRAGQRAAPLAPPARTLAVTCHARHGSHPAGLTTRPAARPWHAGQAERAFGDMQVRGQPGRAGADRSEGQALRGIAACHGFPLTGSAAATATRLGRQRIRSGATNDGGSWVRTRSTKIKANDRAYATGRRRAAARRGAARPGPARPGAASAVYLETWNWTRAMSWQTFAKISWRSRLCSSSAS
jgi:hypothetical protein